MQRQCDTRWEGKRGLSDGEGGEGLREAPMLAWPGLAHARALADPCTARSSQQPAAAACPPLLSSLQAPDQPTLVLLGPRPRLLPPPRALPRRLLPDIETPLQQDIYKKLRTSSTTAYGV